MAEEKEKIIELLNEELGLTPYESKAYIALLMYGPLSPKGVNQKSGIPRPRTYDVLNSLVGKGLLMEQPGRPRMYSSVDPRVGIEKIMMVLERKTLRQLEEKRETVAQLSSSLSTLYVENRDIATEEEKVWVTRRDSAFIARYSEAIRNVEREIVIATPAIRPPEKEILEAVKQVLKKKKVVRVIRQITPQWTSDELDRYEKLIMLGDQVRFLKYRGLRFAVFDEKDTVLVLPSEKGSQIAVWMNLPLLATVLYEHFEVLWKRGQQALPLLRKVKASKA